MSGYPSKDDARACIESEERGGCTSRGDFGMRKTRIDSSISAESCPVWARSVLRGRR